MKKTYLSPRIRIAVIADEPIMAASDITVPIDDSGSGSFEGAEGKENTWKPNTNGSGRNV